MGNSIKAVIILQMLTLSFLPRVTDLTKFVRLKQIQTSKVTLL